MVNLGGLTCRELVELVTEYLEGAMTPEMQRRFEEHLTGCSGCRRYLDHMRKTLKVARALSEDDLSADAQARLLRAFRDWKGGES